ncbi:MAG: Glyoxalase/bleomycin resistance protein/dioxygenase [Parcubacteria group bacterium GW2011_GWF2_50_9]|nr:MAG: Glyoxalase/bleomycin resistance protein/dioxygenase [Parcubacteria group bacterium GW2011_GWF2_50_9]
MFTPYLRFNDEKCREAMNLYKKCFGGNLTLQTVGESPMASWKVANQINRLTGSRTQSY